MARQETENPPSADVEKPGIWSLSPDKANPWYFQDAPQPAPASRELLEKYAGIPPEKVDEHVMALRDKAWAVLAYPCIGTYAFIDTNLSRMACYPRVLSLLRSADGRYLDVGCCMAQDLRRLVLDGIPSERLFGAEPEGRFVPLGYELFGDADTLQAQFLTGTDFTVESDDDLDPQLAALKGTVDVVHLGFVLHCVEQHEEQRMLARCVDMLKPRPGTMLVGHAIGRTAACQRRSVSVRDASVPVTRFTHDPDSFKRLVYGQVAALTGRRLTVRCGLDDFPDASVDVEKHWELLKKEDAEFRRLWFEVEMV